MVGASSYGWSWPCACRRARDLDARALSEPTGRPRVDGVALLADRHSVRRRDRGQRLVIGQEALVAPELDPEERLGAGLHALP
jgi:hypothetical protein